MRTYSCTYVAKGSIGVTGVYPNNTIRFLAKVTGRLEGVTGTPVIANEELLYANSQSYLFGTVH